MNRRYKIQPSSPKLIKFKGLTGLRARLNNVSVETTVTTCGFVCVVKGVDIQKNHVLMFDPINKNSVDEHQPFQLQPKMISKLVSIE